MTLEMWSILIVRIKKLYFHIKHHDFLTIDDSYISWTPSLKLLLTPTNLITMLFSPVVQSLSHVRLCHPINGRTPGFSVHHYLPEFAQTHAHWVREGCCLVIQFSSVAQSCPALCNPMNRSTPGCPVLLFSFPQSLPASGSFPMSQLFAWGSQSIGVSASASVLPMNTQDWSL